MSIDSYPAFGGSMRRRAVPVRQPGADNAARNREAVRRMSEFERLTGVSLEANAAFHAEQRERVRARYGLARAA